MAIPEMLPKIKRTLTSVLPVADGRTGGCRKCGACCKLPNPCLFLRYGPDERAFCAVYSVRPLNCRKYPRSREEFATQNTCGFRFDRAHEPVPAAGTAAATHRAREPGRTGRRATP